MLSMTSYFSVQFFALFLPMVIAAYAFSPEKLRRIVLLLFSYMFFWAISGKLLVYLLFSTLSIHHIGLWLSDSQSNCDSVLREAQKEDRKAIKAHYQKQQRLIVAFAIFVHIGILILLKYSGFILTNLNISFEFLKLPTIIPVPSFILPIGISFYTMQAVSYVIDIYRKNMPADRNILRLALYMSFFPKIMEGPICRYSDTAMQLWSVPPIEYRNLMFGLQRILFGVIKKVVIADRLNIMISNVFGSYQEYDGFIIATVAILYTVQLYMDFSGTMDVALGCGQIFGVKLTENFQRPFFSKTISEFWKRWHITLGTWFRDYIFYPVSLSAPMKQLAQKGRKRFGNYFGVLPVSATALFSVWICNGLWHGSGWNFIFFGMYHFVLILSENIIEPFAAKFSTILHINRDCFVYKAFQILRTTILVCIGEMFFRATSLTAGLEMFKKIISNFSFTSLNNGTLLSLGMDFYDFSVIFVVLTAVFIISLLQEKGISIRESISTKPMLFRFAVYYTMIMTIVIFGAYGAGYMPVEPIYAGF